MNKPSTERGIRAFATDAMRKLVASTLLLCAPIVPAQPQQMYAVAGGINIPRGSFHHTNFPVVLYRVEDGTLSKVRTIATGNQGSKFVRAYHDLNLLLVGSERISWKTLLLEVVDLSRPLSRRTHDIDPSCGECTLIGAHLVKRGGRLIYLMREGPHHDDHRWDHYKIELRPSNSKYSFHGDGKLSRGIDLATGSTVNDLSSGVLQDSYSFNGNNAVMDGIPKHFDFSSQSKTFVTDEDQALHQSLREEIDKLPDRYNWLSVSMIQIINTDELRVLWGPSWNDDTISIYHVLDKGRGDLTKIVWEGNRLTPRAFHHYLVAEEANLHQWEGYNPDRRAGFMTAEGRFHATSVKQTGRFYLHNVRSGTQVIHDTGEPDTEILLVSDDDVAYYRVKDELFRADIGADRLENIELVAKSPMVSHVHWLMTVLE